MLPVTLRKRIARYVYGLSATEPQHSMPGWVLLRGLMTLLPVVMFAPVHFVLDRMYGKK